MVDLAEQRKYLVRADPSANNRQMDMEQCFCQNKVSYIPSGCTILLFIRPRVIFEEFIKSDSLSVLTVGATGTVCYTFFILCFC